MKNSQGASGQTSNAPSHARTTATNNLTDHNNRQPRNQDHATVEVVGTSSTHGHRSKSTNHHGAHHSNRDGPHQHHAHHSSMSHQDSRAGQPRSHSHAKGGASTSTRESTAQQPKSTGGARGGHGQSSGNANAVGHYILGKALGEGTFGKVKLGTHVLTGEKVAVKVLEKSKIKDKKDVERISREIKILKQLHHPNVVQIYEIIETDKDLYLVMEFASGGELFELIVKNQKLKESTASKHLQELLAGVHYIHQLGVCHRDLKPENLLCDYDGQLKIVDFGLSNMYERKTTLKTACGSPCYAAPEMIAGNRYHGLKSDIWSCGVVLYAMLCGFLPFEDQKTSNLYKKIMNAEYTLPKFLSNDAKDIISKIFVTDPAQRIDIEGLKQHPWYRLYQPENQNYNHHTMARTVNEKLLLKMEASLGFSNESVQRAVENNKHNHLSATYYLLLKKYAQASWRTSQGQRNSSVQARVDTRNTDYIDRKRNQNNYKAVEHSDSKNKSVKSATQSRQGSPSKQSAANSTKVQPKTSFIRNSLQQSADRKAIENDRLKAPVQDQLVLKNHRREQSANATAGRNNRNGDWGIVGDERRTESYDRGQPADEYELVISKVNKTTAEEAKQTNGSGDGFNKQNLRANFASPSPDIGPGGGRGRNTSVSAKMPESKATNDSKTAAVKQPMEVNIQNIKSSAYNQVSTPSQTATRATSLPKTSLPKAATYTQATISSQQRSAEKQKLLQQQQQKHERQASAQPTSSSTTTTTNPPASSNHRKAKSIIPDTSQRPVAESQSFNTDKGKFSQTQKIPSYSKSSGQPSRQQNNIPLTVHSGKDNRNSDQQKQTAKVSDLIGNLNKMSQQKTYFDQISGRPPGSTQNTIGSMMMIKQNSKDTAGIEGHTNAQADPVVNVNKNGGGGQSSGIFQSLTSILQRPIIQDINSQNLLKRLESGHSDNQLKQNFATRQSQQQQYKNQSSPSNRKDIPHKRATLKVDDPRQQNSRLSQNTNSHYLNQPISKTPVTGYHQTMDSMGDTSSHELKIPINPDTERGVSKSIFYGTQRIANLNQEIQRYSNDQIQYSTNNGNHGRTEGKDLSKTQAVNVSQTHAYNRSSTNQNDRSNKNVVTHRTESTSRQSGQTSSQTTTQPKTSQSTKHQRHSTTVGLNKKVESDTLNNSRYGTHQRQSHNGYTIPTSSSNGVPQQQQTSTKTTSQSKFQSLKVSSGAAVRLTHPIQQSTIDYQTTTANPTTQPIKINYAQTTTSSTSGPKKVVTSKDGHQVVQQPAHKTRSHSVSGPHNKSQQNTSQIYTPASHRKGTNNPNQTTSLLNSSINNLSGGAATTLTAHYRGSTASSTNKERRGSQPPHQQNQSNNQVNQTQSLLSSQLQQHMSGNNGPQVSQGSKQRSSSSTNYQSAFLVKSLDGRETPVVNTSQRNRQKSTRDNNISIIQQHQPSDHSRQFQSITHVPNTSSMHGLDESTTIFNQSFNGTTAAISNSRYSQQKSSSQYNSRSKNQNQIQNRIHQQNQQQTHQLSEKDLQVASINELLQVAESLKHSNNAYSTRPSQNSVKQSADLVSLLGNATTKQQSTTNPSQMMNNFMSSQQNQTALGTAMKQITEGLMQRQLYQSQQQPIPATSQQNNNNINNGNVTQQQQPQSYLNELFAKQQQNQIQQGYHSQYPSTGVVVKKQGNNDQVQSPLFLSQQQVIANNRQTQPNSGGLKSGLYSPASNSRGKSQLTQQQSSQNPNSSMAIDYNNGKPHQGYIQQQHQYPVVQVQQQQYSDQHQWQQPPQQYSTQPYQGSTPQSPTMAIQYHQQQMQQQQNSVHQQQNNNNYAPPPVYHQLPAQQLSVSYHSFNPNATGGNMQMQKPPSVPAPGTVPAHNVGQPSQSQQQQQMNFYPQTQQYHQ